VPLQLVHSPSPPDLQRFVADLTEGVASGEVSGLGVVVMLKGRRFFVDCFGQMARNPFECIGLVGELEHCLREIGRARRDTNTTRGGQP
jgi:hypothetical protein